MVVGVVSLVLTLVFAGFIAYQWVLASEATAVALAMVVFYVRSYRHGTNDMKWPPLLPTAMIFAAGGAKSFYVATDKDTPLFVIVMLFVGVFWFAVASWRMLHVRRRRHTP
jgi:tellurite resistance protein TehA-like permease